MQASKLAQSYTPQQLDGFIAEVEQLLQQLKEAKAHAAFVPPHEKATRVHRVHQAASTQDPIISLLQSISRQAQTLIEERQVNLAPLTPAALTPAATQTTQERERVAISPNDYDGTEAQESETIVWTSQSLLEYRYSDLDPLNEALLEGLYHEAGDLGYLHVSLVDLEPFSASGAGVNQPGNGHVKSFTYEVDGSFTRVRQADHKCPIAFPDFPLPQSRRCLSPNALKDIWVEAAKAHQKKSVYIIGPPLFDDNIRLSPGEKLLQRGSAPDSLLGIQTEYDYYSLSEGFHLTAMHREDINLASFNLLRSGEAKLWLIVKPEHTSRLEDCLRQEFPRTDSCTQFVRHLGVSICPTKLDSWGIRYTIVCCEAGQAILTGTNVYHQILNLGRNYAKAINIEFPSSPDTPQGYRFCTRECDPHAVTEAHIQFRGTTKQAKNSMQSSASQPSPAKTSSTKRIASECAKLPAKKARHNRSALIVSQELKTWQACMKQDDRLWRFPQLIANPSINCVMARRVCAVQGGHAIRQFCSLVAYRRECKLETGALPLPSCVVQRTAHLLEKLDQLCHGAHYDQVVIRLLQLHIAQEVDRPEAEARARADPQLINQIIEAVGWPRKARQKFHSYLKRGRQWRRVCGHLPGLLCFIPVQKQEPYSVAAGNYLEMEDHEAEFFKSLLDTPFLRQICRSAEVVQESILGTKPDIEFTWETMFPGLSSCKEVISEEELLTLLQPLAVCEENIYDSAQYPQWPRPPGWPESSVWPADPTLVQDEEQQHCELCVELPCHCIRQKFSPGKLRIKLDTEKRLGLQVVAAREGDVAYGLHELIGTISGMVVPGGTFDDEWAHDLTRRVGPDEPTVCQIYVKERGNCFRHLRSSDQPNVLIRQMTISGRRTKVVIASQTIYHGQWITREKYKMLGA